MLKLFAGAVLAAGMLVSAAKAQDDFPSRQVTIVVPYAAGGSTDVNVRLLAEGLQKLWNQTVIVDNRAGGGSAIGTGFVARSAPDGYTMLATTGAFVTLPALRSDLPYDTLRDFSGITNFVDLPIVIVAHPDFAPGTLLELVEEAKKRTNPTLSYASAGFSTFSHMIGELLQEKFDIELNHVPYQGAAAAVPDVLAGRVDFQITPWSDARANVLADKLKIVAVLGAARLPEYPDMPTANEAVSDLGTPGSAFNGIAIPAGVPEAVKRKIAEGIAAVADSAEFKERMLSTGALPTSLTPEETDAFFRSEIDTWTRIAKAANLAQ